MSAPRWMPLAVLAGLLLAVLATVTGLLSDPSLTVEDKVTLMI